MREWEGGTYSAIRSSSGASAHRFDHSDSALWLVINKDLGGAGTAPPPPPTSARVDREAGLPPRSSQGLTLCLASHLLPSQTLASVQVQMPQIKWEGVTFIEHLLSTQHFLYRVL